MNERFLVNVGGLSKDEAEGLEAACDYFLTTGHPVPDVDPHVRSALAKVRAAIEVAEIRSFGGVVDPGWDANGAPV